MIREKSFDLDPVQTFPHLPAAPIVEAVIHWQARAGKWQTSDELKALLASRLPDYPDCQAQQQLSLAAKIGVDSSSTHVRRDTSHGFRLTSDNKRYIAQFTRDGIVFSRLAPYEYWDAFAAEGWRVWRLFLDLAEPLEVQRLGVRFINRIALNQLSAVSQYLVNPPECLDSIGLPTVEFLYQSRHEVPGHPYSINVVRTIQPPTPQQNEQFGLVVDVDVGTTQKLPCDDTVLKQHLMQMHWLKNKAFFSLLTACAIADFKKETP